MARMDKDRGEGSEPEETEAFVADNDRIQMPLTASRACPDETPADLRASRLRIAFSRRRS